MLNNFNNAINFKQTLNKDQFAYLLKILAFGALYVTITFLFSFLFTFMIKHFNINVYDNVYLVTSLIVSFLVVFILTFSLFKWSTNILNSSWLLIIFCYLITSILYGTSLGVFLSFYSESTVLAASIGIIAFLMLLSAFIAWVMSYKFFFKLYQLVLIISFFFIFFSIISPILFYFIGGYDILTIVLDSLIIILGFLYLIIDFYFIFRSKPFYDSIENPEKRLKYCVFFGYKIGSDFMMIIISLLRILSFRK